MMISRRLTLLTFALLSAVAPLARAEDPPIVPKEVIQQAQEVMDAAKKIGPWEQQQQLMDEATDNIFSQQGWNTESDRYARELMRQVGAISPWKPQEREQVFMSGIQSRLSLTQDQRTAFAADLRRETMTFAMKHFKDVMPIMLEVARTRAANEAFTPEQVKEWSQRFKPMMDEGIHMVDRITGRLKRTMNEEQRRRLEDDLRAFRRRHADMRKQVERWQDGKWSPADWGLQNDPLHAGDAARHAAAEAQKNDLVAQARLARNPNEQRIRVNEDSWGEYVKWFCNTYQCDARQRTMADSVLRGSKKEAIEYRKARRDMIAQAEQASKSGDSTGRSEAARIELGRLLQPVTDIFERMKNRLSSEVLTSEQRRRLAPAQPPVAPAPNAAPAQPSLPAPKLVPPEQQKLDEPPPT